MGRECIGEGTEWRSGGGVCGIGVGYERKGSEGGKGRGMED